MRAAGRRHRPDAGDARDEAALGGRGRGREGPRVRHGADAVGTAPAASSGRAGEAADGGGANDAAGVAADGAGGRPASGTGYDAVAARGGGYPAGAPYAAGPRSTSEATPSYPEDAGATPRTSSTSDRPALSCQPCDRPEESKRGLSSTTRIPPSGTTPTMIQRSAARPNPTGPRVPASTVRMPVARLPSVLPVEPSQNHTPTHHASASTAAAT